MNYDETEWMTDGLCATDPEAKRLFMSPFLEKFSENDFYEDHIGNEKLTGKELAEKKARVTASLGRKTHRT